MKSTQNERAEHLLYKVYWKLVLSDILTKQGFEDTKEAKDLLHDFHKRVLGYPTISNESHEVVSLFIQKVVLFWGERGIFVRTSKKQPYLMEFMDLADCWDLL